ncbi:MAG: STAS domain-containing protein [Clostridia bacterium]|nr:STAS domain-containing protein [Clostridia bacterium]
MDIRLKKEDGKLFIALNGRLDTVTSAELKQELDREGIENLDIDFDFTEVAYISSAGLRLIVALQKQTDETGNTLVIRNINKVVSEIFRVAGFDKVLKIL